MSSIEPGHFYRLWGQPKTRLVFLAQVSFLIFQWISYPRVVNQVTTKRHFGLLIMASSSNAGMDTVGRVLGTVPQTHRGHGFALGHPQFQLPSANAPVNPNVRGRATSMPRSPRAHHGSSELGTAYQSRDRERDRGYRSPSVRSQQTEMDVQQPMPTVSATVGDPAAQATAHRSKPAGPQEAAEWSQALENVISRLLSIENTQRKHPQMRE